MSTSTPIAVPPRFTSLTTADRRALADLLGITRAPDDEAWDRLDAVDQIALLLEWIIVRAEGTDDVEEAVARLATRFGVAKAAKPTYAIKVPNGDEGKDLGEYEADYLPRVGDSFTLWHPRVCAEKDRPFCGVVDAVTHEAFHISHPYSSADCESAATTTVWLVEEQAAPTLYCECSEAERAPHGTKDGKCENCGHVARGQ